MRIFIDNSNLNVGGGIQVATSFLNDLKNLDNMGSLNDFELIHIIQSSNSSLQIDKNYFSKKFIFHDLDKNCEKSITKRVAQVKKIEHAFKPDIIFTVFGPSYHKSKCPKIVGFAIPHLIYTNSPYFNSLSVIKRVKQFCINRIKNFCFLKNSDVLIFESGRANEIYSSKYKKKTYTVNNTLNSIFDKKEFWEDIFIQKTNFDILCLSANYPHKNLKLIPEIIDYILSRNVISNFKIHISGIKENFSFSENHNVYINYLGHVKLEKLPSLYSQMDCLLMPTLLEVFSTTYLEAMFMKIPIVSSDMDFARDVCGNAALYSAPTDAKEYGINIIKLYKYGPLRNKLIENGTSNLKKFGNSLDRTKKYIEIINETKKTWK